MQMQRRIDWAKINKIVEETPEVKTFLIDVPEDFTWEEGAHTHFALKGFNEGEGPNRELIRHMSISTLPNEGAIGITTRIKELCSEFKSILKTIEIGTEVALFKTHSNMPLKEEGKNIYFLTAGVGIATVRPLALKYLQNDTNVPSIHSLNVDSSAQYVFTDVFTTNEEKNFTAQYVNSRDAFYAEVTRLVQADKDGIYYIVGSNDFLKENIALLREHGVETSQMMIDKRASFLEEFFGAEAANVEVK
ncbi:dihydropteridine reductase [Caryophanon latum]|nr:dihydropteridine reductase [Caryophanon latum]